MKRGFISRQLPAEKGKRRLKQALLTVFGLLWFWFFLPVPTYGVLNIGNGAGMLLFGGAFLLTLYTRQVCGFLKRAWQKKAGRALTCLLGALLLAGFALAGVNLTKIAAGALHAPPEAVENDATVLVLGCKVTKSGAPSQILRRRLEAAADYLQAHPDVTCIVSGGQGDDEPVSEASSMAKWLTDHGVDAGRILIEDASTTTEENLRFSAAIIEERDLPGTLVIVTNEFHQYRAGLIADKLGYAHYAVNGPSPIVLLPTYIAREVFGIVYEALFR